MLQQDELKNLAPGEFESEIRKARLELYKLNLSRATNQLKETHKLKILRRYIQRLMTLKRFMVLEAKPTKPSPSKS